MYVINEGLLVGNTMCVPSPKRRSVEESSTIILITYFHSFTHLLLYPLSPLPLKQLPRPPHLHTLPPFYNNNYIIPQNSPNPMRDTQDRPPLKIAPHRVLNLQIRRHIYVARRLITDDNPTLAD